jgi:hypothetical protein
LRSIARAKEAVVRYDLLVSGDAAPTIVATLESHNIFDAVLAALSIINDPPDDSMKYRIDGDRAIIRLSCPSRTYILAPVKMG